MKRLLVLLCVGALLCGAPAALAQEAAPAPSVPAEAQPESIISATGTCRMALKADMAVLTLDVRATAATVSDAQTQASTLLLQLRGSLEALGIAHNDIHTSGYRVQTLYNYQNTKLGEKAMPTGHDVTGQIKVRVRDVSRVGEAIDTAIANGAESGYDLSFESSAYNDVYCQALSEAARDAMRKAQLLADASGFELGKLRSVMETSAPQAGDPLEVVATVEVRYAVKQP